MEEERNTIEEKWKRMMDKIKKVVRKVEEERWSDRGNKRMGRGMYEEGKGSDKKLERVERGRRG